MKKYLALALAVVLLAVGLTSCAAGLGDQSAIDNYAPDVDYLITDDGTFYFKEIEGGAAALVNYIGKATKEDRVTVPAAFNDRVVTEIGAEAPTPMRSASAKMISSAGKAIFTAAKAASPS